MHPDRWHTQHQLKSTRMSSRPSCLENHSFLSVRPTSRWHACLSMHNITLILERKIKLALKRWNSRPLLSEIMLWKYSRNSSYIRTSWIDELKIADCVYSIPAKGNKNSQNEASTTIKQSKEYISTTFHNMYFL